MEIKIIILGVMVLILVCIVAGLWTTVKDLEEQCRKLSAMDQRLIDIAIDVDREVSGGKYCHRENLTSVYNPKHYEMSLMHLVKDLINDVEKLKEADNNKKELEIIAERKEKMADYLMLHPNDSINSRVAALYDIANERVEEDK